MEKASAATLGEGVEEARRRPRFIAAAVCRLLFLLIRLLLQLQLLVEAAGQGEGLLVVVVELLHLREK